MLKKNKLLITSTTSIINQIKPFYRFSTKFATSYFSKLNLKEKHSSEFKKQKKSNSNFSKSSSSTDQSASPQDSLTSKLTELQKKNTTSEKHKSWTSPIEALQDMKKQPIRGEHEVIQLTIGLNVDYRKGDQNVRGIFKMPGGSTKTPKVIAFVPVELAEKASAAGADLIGDHETIKEIQNGQINFEKCVCTIDMLPLLKSVGRILGPMGLMPNAKIGTATSNDKLEGIIRDLKLGSKEFRVDPRGQIIVPIGKRDFTIENVLQNIHSFMAVLMEKKPETIKGRYLLYGFLNARRLAYKVEMKSLDPKTNSYFMNALKKPEEAAAPQKADKKEVGNNAKAEENKENVNIAATQPEKREKKKKNKETESSNNNTDNAQKDNY
jgi:large subunit ribosomal protein L1